MFERAGSSQIIFAFFQKIIYSYSMTIRKQNKLKFLLQQWPAHTVMTSRVLKEQGLSYSNIENYQRSQWVTPVGTGAFKKASDTVSWEGAIYGLQQHYKKMFFIGGKTALELSGAAHFIPFKQSTLFLFSSDSKPPPLWLRNIDCGPTFDFHTQHILPPLEGRSQYDCGEFFIEISARERAAIEMAALVEKVHSFQEISLIFENLGSLRPKILQSLLTSCSSIKAKRVVLFLGHHNHHPWYTHLDLSLINLGEGPREITKNGIYDSQFKITYPKELFENDLLKI